MGPFGYAWWSDRCYKEFNLAEAKDMQVKELTSKHESRVKELENQITNKDSKYKEN